MTTPITTPPPIRDFRMSNAICRPLSPHAPVKCSQRCARSHHLLDSPGVGTQTGSILKRAASQEVVFQFSTVEFSLGR